MEERKLFYGEYANFTDKHGYTRRGRVVGQYCSFEGETRYILKEDGCREYRCIMENNQLREKVV